MNMPKIKKAVVGCAIMLLVTMPTHAGFILVFYIPFIVIATLWNTYLIYTKPTQRRVRLIKVALWLVCFNIVFTSHAYRHTETRTAANQIIEKIEQFHTLNNRYPVNLDEVGITRRELRDKLGMAVYRAADNDPSLFYAVTYMIYDTYRYNFKTKRWEYQSS